MKTLGLIVCAIVSLNTFSQSYAQVKLRYKMEKGNTYTYQKVETAKQSQMVQGQKIQTDMKNKTIIAYTLQKVDAKGNLHLQANTKQLKVSMKIGPVGEYTFDSTKKENDKESKLGESLTPIFERLCSAKIGITIDPLGKVLKVTGYKELMEGVLKNKLAKQLAGKSAETAKYNLGRDFPELSKKALEVNSQWVRKYEMKLPKIGTVTGKRIYIYDGPGKVGKHKTAKITVTTELSVDIDLDQDGAKVKGNVSFTNSSGTIHFDVQQGLVRSLQDSLTMSGNLKVTAGGIDIPVTMEQTQSVTMELLDKAPE